MDVRITGHGMNVSDEVRGHLQDKVHRFEKYSPRLVESHVILKKQKYFFQSEITLLAKNFKAFGEGQSKDNVFAAIDQAADRVEKQLKKYREKLKSHHKGIVASKEFRTTTAAPSVRGAVKAKKSKTPQVILSENVAPIPMTIQDAGAQLQASRDSFLVFYNLKSEKNSIIFKREDGKHGLIEI